jgi:hypothetical protein
MHYSYILGNVLLELHRDYYILTGHYDKKDS